jgi:hypothetical protein
VLFRPLAERLEELLLRGLVPVRGALDHIGCGQMLGRAPVVTEQVQLHLDRVGRLQPLHEAAEGPRLRRLVDDPEQMRRDLVRAEQHRVDGLDQVDGHRLQASAEPVLPEVEGVVVCAVTDGADAHQHLRRLGDVDLDLDPAGAGEIEHRCACATFDSHLTNAA